MSNEDEPDTHSVLVDPRDLARITAAKAADVCTLDQAPQQR